MQQWNRVYGSITHGKKSRNNKQQIFDLKFEVNNRLECKLIVDVYKYINVIVYGHLLFTLENSFCSSRETKTKTNIKIQENLTGTLL